MSDYQSQQDAAAFWRKVQKAAATAALDAVKTQTGITPGVKYGSTIYDAYGRAVWGSEGVGVIGQGCALSSGDQNVPTGALTTLFFESGEVFYFDTGYYDLGVPEAITLSDPGRYLFSYQAHILLAPGTKATAHITTDGANASLIEETSEWSTTNAEGSNSILALGNTFPWQIASGPENYWIEIEHNAGFTAAVSFAFSVVRLV